MFALRRHELALYIEADIWHGRNDIVHAFGTRWCGDTVRSAGGNINGEDDYSAARRMADILGTPSGQVITAIQVHGDDILMLDGTDADTVRRLTGDGLVTNRPGVAVGIRTADCVPLLMFDQRRRVIGAIHAGWKGAALDIAGKAVGVFAERFLSNPLDIQAVVGPSVGQCCYEVGPEVVRAMSHHTWSDGLFDPGRPDGRRMLDLGRAVTRQLVDEGLDPANIVTIPLCTSCRDDLFYSHRGEGGRTGRQISAIMLRE